MKLALIFFFILSSLSMWFPAQEPQPVICRGMPVPIKGLNLTGSEVWTRPMPLRFGGTREAFPLQFPSDKAFRLVIKNRDEFTDFGKRLYARVRPEKVPRLPEIDFSKEIIVVVGTGIRTNSGILVDGACEVDGQVEVFVINTDGTCIMHPGIDRAPADAVRLPRTDLPIVFRETQLDCTQTLDLIQRMTKRGSVPEK